MKNMMMQVDFGEDMAVRGERFWRALSDPVSFLCCECRSDLAYLGIMFLDICTICMHGSQAGRLFAMPSA